MRSKIVIALSVIILCTIGVLLYKNSKNKSIDDYVETEESAYKTVIDNYSFYADEVTDNEAIDVANMLSLLGLDNDVIVAEEPINEEGDDFNRDTILSYADSIDYSELVYSVNDGDIYYVWTDAQGAIRGMRLDAEYNLIELR